MYEPKPLREDEPCSHPGCLAHASHPCEGCGRILGRYPDHYWAMYWTDLVYQYICQVNRLALVVENLLEHYESGIIQLFDESMITLEEYNRARLYKELAEKLIRSVEEEQ